MTDHAENLFMCLLVSLYIFEEMFSDLLPIKKFKNPKAFTHSPAVTEIMPSGHVACTLFLPVAISSTTVDPRTTQVYLHVDFFNIFVLLYYMIQGSLIHGYRTVCMGETQLKVKLDFWLPRVKGHDPSVVQGSAVQLIITNSISTGAHWQETVKAQSISICTGPRVAPS